MLQPPVLPEEKLARVERVGRAHGTCVLFVAAFFALLSGVAGDYLGAIVGLLVAGAGAIESHGAALLREGEPRGVTWLVGSQFFLFVTIGSYCVLRLIHIELPPIPDELRPMLELNASQAGLSVQDYLMLVYRLGFWTLLILSVFYQGGMALYYFMRRDSVARALGEE
ncbi:MAG TPA: hypothetical protein VM029_22785 [Opitutaceae bacterium]|nr:hypothetical protein [Opitutaceae bacterium]